MQGVPNKQGFKELLSFPTCIKVKIRVEWVNFLSYMLY